MMINSVCLSLFSFFFSRDLLIERLTKEIHELRAELERVKAEVKFVSALSLLK